MSSIGKGDFPLGAPIDQWALGRDWRIALTKNRVNGALPIIAGTYLFNQINAFPLRSKVVAPVASGNANATPVPVTGTFSAVNPVASDNANATPSALTGAFAVVNPASIVAPSVVQYASAGSPDSASPPVTVTVAPVAAGNLLVIAATCSNTTIGLTPTSDVGQTFDSRGVVSSGLGGEGQLALWTVENCVAGSTTFTVTRASGAGQFALVVYEISGENSGAGLLDTASTTSLAAQSASPVSVGSPSPTTYANDLLLAIVSHTAGAPGPGTGTQSVFSSPGGSWTFDGTVSSARTGANSNVALGYAHRTASSVGDDPSAAFSVTNLAPATAGNGAVFAIRGVVGNGVAGSAVATTAALTGTFSVVNPVATGGSSGPAFVAEMYRNGLGGGTQADRTFALTAGAAIGTRVCMFLGGSYRDLVSVTDARGNTWTVHQPVYNTSLNRYSSLASAHITTALIAGDNVTVNFSGTSGYIDPNAVVASFSGVKSTSVFTVATNAAYNNVFNADATNASDGLIFGVVAGNVIVTSVTGGSLLGASIPATNHQVVYGAATAGLQSFAGVLDSYGSWEFTWVSFEGDSPNGTATPAAVSATFAAVNPVATGGGNPNGTATPAALVGTFAVVAPVARGSSNTLLTVLTGTFAAVAPVTSGASNTALTALAGAFTTVAPVASGAANALPVALAATFAAVAPVAKGSANVTLTALAGAFAAVNPIATGAGVGTATPAAITGTIVVVAPVASGSASILTTALTGTFTAVNPVAGVNVSAAPAALAGAFSVVAPVATAGASKTLTALTGTFAVVPPTLSAGVNVLPVALTGIFAVVAPVATGQQSATALPAVLTGTFAVVNPVATGVGAGTATPSALVGTFVAAAPVATGSASVAVLALGGTFAAVNPVAGVNVAALPPALAGAFAAVAPIATGGASKTLAALVGTFAVVAPVASGTANGTALPPTIPGTFTAVAPVASGGSIIVLGALLGTFTVVNPVGRVDVAPAPAALTAVFSVRPVTWSAGASTTTNPATGTFAVVNPFNVSGGGGTAAKLYHTITTGNGISATLSPSKIQFTATQAAPKH